MIIRKVSTLTKIFETSSDQQGSKDRKCNLPGEEAPSTELKSSDNHLRSTTCSILCIER